MGLPNEVYDSPAEGRIRNIIREELERHDDRFATIVAGLKEQRDNARQEHWEITQEVEKLTGTLAEMTAILVEVNNCGADDSALRSRIRRLLEQKT